MTLGEFCTGYRKEHDLSVRAFASMVKMSPQQIINIEKGTGNDGKPMTSTMKTYKKIANGIGMEENAFMKMLNDEVLVNPAQKNPATDGDGLSEKYEEIKSIIDQLNQENSESLKGYALFLLQRQQSQGDQ